MADFEFRGDPAALSVELALVAISLTDFSASLIAHVRTGGTLDDTALGELRARCILQIKDAGAQGLPIQQEAESLRKALQQLEQMLDLAIAKGGDSQ